MHTQKLAGVIFLFFIWTTTGAQQTSVYSDAQAAFKRGMEFFESGIPAKARREFQETADLLLPVNEAEAEMLRTRALLYIGKSSVLMKTRDGELKTLEFIRTISPDPEYKLALADLGDFYFNNRKYEDALRYYGQIPETGLPKKQMEQVRFRQGYAHFLQKQYPEAKPYFQQLQDETASPYYAPANYYLGFCFFQEGNYEQAYRCMANIENDLTYKNEIPYIQGQILFAQRRYQEVVQKLQSKANDTRVGNRKEINQLVGQSLFELGKFKESLPYLEYYAASSSRLREEELYQLGFAQYQEKKYAAAIGNLRPLSGANSLIGQNAMFYLANCYLQTGDKKGALNALGTAKRMNFDPELQEEAMFNHAKLSFELNQPREAANELSEIKPSSRFFNEAQTLLSQVLLGLKDYRLGFEIAEEMMKTNRSPQLLATYQKLALNHGIQLLQEGNADAARPVLQKAADNPSDSRTQAIAVYWLGDIANRKEQYAESIKHIDQMLTLARTVSGLPDESGIFTAQYIQGYNFLKTGRYDQSRAAFQAAVDGINNNLRFIKNQEITGKLLGDATMRLGDSYFRINQYQNASRYYRTAIDRKISGYDYAIYQNALIEGLTGKPTEEILALERLVRDFPNSEYTDDALFRLGEANYTAGRNKEALDALRNLVAKYRSKSPLINRALLQLGLITFNLDDFETAGNYYKQVFSNNPDADEAKVAMKGLQDVYLLQLDRPEEYYKFLETIPGYKLENADRDALAFKVAQKQAENKDYRRAIESFSNYIRDFPKGINISAAYFLRGENYAALKEYSKALTDYESAAAQGPGNYYLKALSKGALVASTQILDFARAYRLYSELEKAATKEEMIFEAQLGALSSAYRIKNLPAVNTYADKILRNPKSTNEHKATANYHLAKLAFDNQEYAKALPALEFVIKNGKPEERDEAAYLKAFSYYRQKDLRQAGILAEDNSRNAQNLYWAAKSAILLSDILVEQGELLEAEALLEGLIEGYTSNKEITEQATTRLAQIKNQIEQNSILIKKGGN